MVLCGFEVIEEPLVPVLNFCEGTGSGLVSVPFFFKIGTQFQFQSFISGGSFSSGFFFIFKVCQFPVLG